MYTGTERIQNLIGISRLADKETILHKSTAKGSQRVQNYYILDTTSFNRIYPDYERESNGVYNNIDLRRSLWFNGFTASFTITARTVNFNRIWNTWYKVDGNRSNSVDYLDIGTPEMMLIRSECLARNNQLT